MGRTRKISRQRGGNIKYYGDRQLAQELQRLERLLKAQIQGFKPRNIVGKTQANIKAVEMEMAARRKNSENAAQEREEAEAATAAATAASKAAAAEEEGAAAASKAAAEAKLPPPLPKSNIQRMLNNTNANLQSVRRNMEGRSTLRNRWSSWINGPIDIKIKELDTYTNKVIAEAKSIVLTYVRNALISRNDTRSMEEKAEAMLESQGKNVTGIQKLVDEKARLEGLRYKNDKIESWRLRKIGEVESVLENMKERLEAVHMMEVPSAMVGTAATAGCFRNARAMGAQFSG